MSNQNSGSQLPLENLQLEDYQVLPKHVGQWEGTVRFLDANLQETKQHKITQKFQALENKWVITNTYLYADGNTFTHSFDLIPVGNGQVKLSTQDDPRFNDYQLFAQEHSGNIVDFLGINNKTGMLEQIETITLSGNDNRVRTTQIFTDSGELKNLIIVVEKRIE